MGVKHAHHCLPVGIGRADLKHLLRLGEILGYAEALHVGQAEFPRSIRVTLREQFKVHLGDL